MTSQVGSHAPSLGLTLQPVWSVFLSWHHPALLQFLLIFHCGKTPHITQTHLPRNFQAQYCESDTHCCTIDPQDTAPPSCRTGTRHPVNNSPRLLPQPLATTGLFSISMSSPTVESMSSHVSGIMRYFVTLSIRLSTGLLFVGKHFCSYLIFIYWHVIDT